jgi:hypothetical protein
VATEAHRPPTSHIGVFDGIPEPLFDSSKVRVVLDRSYPPVKARDQRVENLRELTHSDENTGFMLSKAISRDLCLQSQAFSGNAIKGPGLLKNGNVFAEGKSRLVLIG